MTFLNRQNTYLQFILNLNIVLKHVPNYAWAAYVPAYVTTYVPAKVVTLT
jgi:hypothetical protein